MKAHRSMMLDLQKKHDVIHELLKNKNFHYIDIPMHDNIGDLLMSAIARRKEQQPDYSL